VTKRGEGVIFSLKLRDVIYGLLLRSRTLDIRSRGRWFVPSFHCEAGQ